MTRRVIAFCLILCSACFSADAKRAQVSDLPTLYIDMAQPGAVIDKETYLDCALEFVGADADTLFADGRIRGRGNSTWALGDKKPYRIKFYSKHRFLGPAGANAKNWVLLANNFDKTLMRNAVAAHIARLCGQPFAPGAKFVDVVLDGRFVGNYQITDHIDIRKRRVNIVEQDTLVGPDADISGGYLLEICNDEWGADVFQSDFGTSVRVKSPDDDVISKPQWAYICDYVNRLEKRLFSPSFADPEEGYRSMVDSLTLASWYLANELTANPDAFWSSNIYKERGDEHLRFGPVWDFDIAFNNSSRMGDTEGRLMLDYAFHSTTGAGAWIGRMRADPWFSRLLAREWRRISDSGIEENVIAYIDSVAATLDASQRLNYEIYNIGQSYWDERLLFSSYLEGVEYLKDQVRQRVAFMDEVFSGETGGGSEIPAPEPSGYVVPDRAGLYRIYNAGVKKSLRASEEHTVVIWDDAEADSDGFLWELRPEGDCFRIVNRGNGLAVSDSRMESGEWSHGSPLLLRPVQEGTEEQLWHVSPLGNAENSCVVSGAATGLAWNNYGGNSADGNSVITWTNDADNEWKLTRQWCFSLVEELNEDGAETIDAPAYAVTYSPSEGKLRFIVYGYEAADGRMELYSLSGMRLKACNVTPEVDISELQDGVYVLRWRLGNETRTLKFRK